jgi:hypothetical protein
MGPSNVRSDGAYPVGVECLPLHRERQRSFSAFTRRNGGGAVGSAMPGFRGKWLNKLGRVSVGGTVGIGAT